jgi:hypothetical protein
MFPAAATSYTVPDLILDLAIDKSHNPYEIRINHTPPNYFDPSRTVQEFPHSENIEILSARRGYLLTAGGRYSEADYWYTELLSQFAGGVSEEDEEDEGAGEHHGWPHPTTLIVRNRQRIHEPLAPTGLPRCDPSRLEPGDPDDYLIYSWGTHIHDENRNNTAVWRNFAAGTAGFHVPCQYKYDVVNGENLWKFNCLSEPGLNVAIHHSSGILDVVDDELHGGPTFDAFRSNAERQRIRFGQGTYETIDGHQITYNVNLSEGEPPGRWPISHINGEAQEEDR